jgi:hypothetical protein
MLARARADHPELDSPDLRALLDGPGSSSLARGLSAEAEPAGRGGEIAASALLAEFS